MEPTPAWKRWQEVPQVSGVRQMQRPGHNPMAHPIDAIVLDVHALDRGQGRGAAARGHETDRPVSRVCPDRRRRSSYERSSRGDDHMEAITLKGICAELKIAPRVGRSVSPRSTQTSQTRTNRVS